MKRKLTNVRKTHPYLREILFVTITQNTFDNLLSSAK